MKIKYISNYLDGTDWSKAATYNILALDNMGHEVELQNHTYNNQVIYLDQKIQELEINKFNNHDLIILHVLPSAFQNFGQTKTVGVVALETKNLSNKFWRKKISLTDKVISTNNSTKEALKTAGIESKVFNNLFDFNRISSAKKIREIKELKTSFNFVFNADNLKVKNLEALLKAYHLEFHKCENVSLVIISSSPKIEDFCKEIKLKLKLSSAAKKEIIISPKSNELERLTVMRHCHATVIPSYGEWSCYSAMESLAMGLPVIYTENNGLEDVLDESCSISVKSSLIRCYGANDTFNDLYTSNDKWMSIDSEDLGYKMRILFNMFVSNRQEYLNMQELGIKTALKRDWRNAELNKEFSELLETL